MQRVLKRKTEDRQKKPNDTESEVSQEPIATVEKVPTQQYEVGSFIESYPLIEPYAHAAIGLEPETKRIRYYLIEPSVTEEDMKIVKQLTDILAWELEVDVNALGSAADREKYLKGKILEAIMRYKIKVDQHVIDKLTYYLIRDFVYLGKIEPLLRDHLIEDVSCDGPHVPIFVWH
ncbi:MAG: type IV secretory pathway protein, partial [Candidatus Bathyarchaeia archaeon]